MRITFKTNIDKYKGMFPRDFQIIPRVGEFVEVTMSTSATPFLALEVQRVTYQDKDNVVVELHLSETQAKENIAYNLGVFN